MDYIQKQIEEHIVANDPDEEVIVLKTGSHSGFLTYDGIDVNGKRVADEIMQQYNSLTNSDDKDKVTKLSVVGYSLGGLIARYAIGVLYFQGFFNDIEPINFVTFCSPHVGVLTPGKGITTKLFNLFVPFFLAHSGSQMFLLDKKMDADDNKDGLPLLVWMAEPQSFFFKALSSFKYKSLYANIINDKRTCWFTSAISIMDPFKSMLNADSSIYNLDYIPGYEPTVIDLDKPIVISKVKQKVDDPGVEINWLKNFFERKFNWIKFICTLVIYTPLWGCYFIMKSAFERVKLNRRVNSFFLDTSNNLLHLYTLVGDEAVAFANDSILVEDNDLEHKTEKEKNKVEIDEDSEDTEGEDDEETRSITSAQSMELFSTPFTTKLSDQTDGLIQSVFDAMNSERYKDFLYSVKSSNNSDKIIIEIENTGAELALSESQKLIVENLNSLNWAKFPVLIRNTKSTHAAAIVKIDDESYAEGKTVIRHFVNEVFKTS